MPRLRYHRTWVALGWGIIAAIIWLSLTPSPPQVGMGFRFADKLQHVLAYFVLMGWFVQIYSRRLGLLAAGFVGLGVILELLQGAGGVRYLELADMVANTAGVLLAWALAPTPFGRILEMLERRLVPLREWL